MASASAAALLSATSLRTRRRPEVDEPMRQSASSCRISRLARCRPGATMRTDMPRTSALSAKVPAMNQTAIFTTAQGMPVAPWAHVGPPGEGRRCPGRHPGAPRAPSDGRLRTWQDPRCAIRSEARSNGRSEDNVRRWFGAAVAAILISVASPDIGAASPPTGRFIVVLTDTVAAPSQAAAAHARRYHLGVSAVYRSAIRGYAARPRRRLRLAPGRPSRRLRDPRPPGLRPRRRRAPPG